MEVIKKDNLWYIYEIKPFIFISYRCKPKQREINDHLFQLLLGHGFSKTFELCCKVRWLMSPLRIQIVDPNCIFYRKSWKDYLCKKIKLIEHR